MRQPEIAFVCKVCQIPLGTKGLQYSAKFQYCERCAQAEIHRQIDLKEATQHLQKKKRTPFSDQFRNMAGRYVSIAISAGFLPKARSLSCVDCGKPAECYDHRDYAKPLEVDAVCRGCNVRRAVADDGDLYLLAEARRARAVEHAKPAFLRAIKGIGYARTISELAETPAIIARRYVFGGNPYSYERLERLSGGAVSRFELRPDYFVTDRKAA